MKQFLAAALLLSAGFLAHPAFAERWVAPVNGTVSAVMTKDGAVMMKVQMPAKEFAAMKADMDAGRDCKIENIYPGATDTMILVCR